MPACEDDRAAVVRPLGRIDEPFHLQERRLPAAPIRVEHQGGVVRRAIPIRVEQDPHSVGRPGGIGVHRLIERAPRRRVRPGQIDDPDVAVRRRSRDHRHGQTPLVRAEIDVHVPRRLPDDAERLARAIEPGELRHRRRGTSGERQDRSHRAGEQASGASDVHVVCDDGRLARQPARRGVKRLRHEGARAGEQEIAGAVGRRRLGGPQRDWRASVEWRHHELAGSGLRLEIQHVAAVRQELRLQMALVAADHRGDRGARAAAGVDLVQAVERPGAEHDHVVAVPRSAAGGRHRVAEGDRRPARRVDLPELASGEEPDISTIRGPERTAPAFGPAQRTRG